MVKDSTIGKLPLSLYSQRERFLVALWKYFKSTGISGDKIDGNAIPFLSVQELADYIRKNFEVNSAEAVFENSILKLKVTLSDNSSVTFNPYQLSNLIYRIEGEEALKPEPNELISPSNPKFMKFMAKFLDQSSISQDYGICFSDDGVFSANHFSMIWIHTKGSQRGHYTEHGLKFDVKWPPNYLRGVPDIEKHTFGINVAELLSIVEKFNRIDVAEGVEHPRITISGTRFSVRVNSSTNLKWAEGIQTSGHFVSPSETNSVTLINATILPILKLLKSQQVKYIYLKVNRQKSVRIDVNLKDYGDATIIFSQKAELDKLEKIEDKDPKIISKKYTYRLRLQLQQMELQKLK
ncbi:hypothetical protein [Flectobacillus sp. BAB-3569]|uniref:hypothetical protein n=1 Tax=Flectobacillus sp. BAB-3569 TaxID=1509483 RepID=UPI000BA42685|nr:hypothetical protein [Flectobacillus sp. BAB-3569]PAC33290.1 hypothetical protein BWI92_01940 [Flectobacillus sp. BAB-3569]